MVFGTLACWLGQWFGSIFGLLLSRYLFRKKAKRLAKKYKWISAFDMAMDTDGVMFLVIMRICPLVPHAIQNYIMGATAMKMRHFAMTGFFIMPYTAMMIFYGTTISSITDAVEGNADLGPWGLSAMIGGSVLAIIASIFLSCVVKKHLNKMVADAEAAKEQTKTDNADEEKGSEKGEDEVDVDDVEAKVDTGKPKDSELDAVKE